MSTLAERVVDAPQLATPAEARRRVAALVRAPEAAGLAAAIENARVSSLLLGLADHSPYLWTLAAEDPPRLARLLGRPPEESLDALLESLLARRDDEGELMRSLRLAKREAALLIALADIGGVWGVVATTEALTRFADAAVGAALEFLLRQSARAGRLALDPEDSDLQAGCGMVVLALGKHGARELNYSSDIDLIVLYDAASAAVPAGTEPGPLFVRITKALARILQERTRDGYVLRVDLRLRPDPASTAGGAVDDQRLRLLRDGGPELGAGGADQGEARGRRSRSRQALPRRSRPFHLAQIFRLCGDRRHPRDEAADPCGSRT